MTLREAAQMALKALEYWEWGDDPDEEKQRPATPAIIALRAALAEPEPVMHQYKYQAYGYYKEDGKLKLGTIPEPQTTHWEGCEAVHPECGMVKQAVAAEREACARACENLSIDRGTFHPDDQQFKEGVLATARMCSLIIRSRT